MEGFRGGGNSIQGLSSSGPRPFTLRKLECSKRARKNFSPLNTSAWDNGIGPRFLFPLVSGSGVMIDRDSWGHRYLIVRGEILGFMKDQLPRKHLPRMFSLIKNES